jgi:hypothetical protein
MLERLLFAAKEAKEAKDAPFDIRCQRGYASEHLG